MMRLVAVLCALYAGSALAQAASPPAAAQDAMPAQQERSLSERAGAVVGRAAEETTSAFGRALQWTGRQLEGAGQWTARQGETIGADRPANAPAPSPALPPPVPAR
jgi:hypothetical protein